MREQHRRPGTTGGVRPQPQPPSRGLSPAGRDSALQRAASTPLRPALDAGAEADADRIAADVVDAVGPLPGLRPDGERLPAPVAGALTPEVGPVDHVRVHADRLSEQLAAAMGARAFSAGSDIYLGGGEGGADLLAHEAAHAVLHPQPAANLVHAKLAGTSAALVSQGGGPSKGRLNKMLGKHWDKLLKTIAAYEALEAQVVAGSTALQKSKPRMLKLLDGVEKEALAWQKANGGRDVGETARRHNVESGQMREEDMLQADPRRKAGRAQAVAMLLPRVREERKALKTNTWSKTLSLNAESLVAVGREDRGQVNIVKELLYDVGDDLTLSGYFKADAGLNIMAQPHELVSGIAQLDANYGARAVAMTRIDELLGTHLLAQTHFATHEGQMGTVSATAVGQKVGSMGARLTYEDRDAAAAEDTEGKSYFAAEDPVLQRRMNELQILDAICGQLDRHMGNVYIETDAAGNVVGLTGIDLDMAFGKDLRTGSKADMRGAANFKGMPPIADAELGDHILSLVDAEVRAAVDGLLDPEEVEATVARFTWVQGELVRMKNEGLFVGEWNLDTLAMTQGDVVPGQSMRTGYLQGETGARSDTHQAERTRFIESLLLPGGAATYDGPGSALLRQLQPEVRAALSALIRGYTSNRTAIGRLQWQGKVSTRGERAIILGLIETVLTNDELVAAFADVVLDYAAQTALVFPVLDVAAAQLARDNAYAGAAV